MKKLLSWFLILLPLTFSPASAEDLNFATSKEGIIDALLNPKTKSRAKTRSIDGAGTAKTRGMRIVRDKSGETVEDTIYLSDEASDQGVNLKIKFDFDSYAIRPESYGLIAELGQALTDDRLKQKDIVINGHTDSSGAETYNLELSLKRALAVKTYLIENFNISTLRLEVVGYGESLPLVSNSSEANRQINRRVEIVAK
jgi:outer membrane protein OmpA-like peptidoglycan-associated protein